VKKVLIHARIITITFTGCIMLLSFLAHAENKTTTSWVNQKIVAPLKNKFFNKNSKWIAVEPEGSIDLEPLSNSGKKHRNLAIIAEKSPRNYYISRYIPNHRDATDSDLASLLRDACTPVLVDEDIFAEHSSSNITNFKNGVANIENYHTPGFFLLVPKPYLNACNAQSVEDLGLNLEHFKSVDAKEIPSYKDTSWSWWLVKGKSDDQYSKTVLSLVRTHHNDQKFLWNIMFFGHGYPGSNACGISAQGLGSIINNLAKKISINAFFYYTCYGGSVATAKALQLDKNLNVPVISVGYKNDVVYIDDHVGIDYKGLCASLQTLNTDVCCWKERAASNLNAVTTHKGVSFEGYEPYPFTNYERKIYCVSNLICLRDPATKKWTLPQAPDFYITSKQIINSSAEKILNSPVFIMNTYDFPGTLILTNREQRISSGIVGGEVVHHIKKLVVESLDDIAYHFATSGEESYKKIYLIDELTERNNPAKVLRQVVITAPGPHTFNNEWGKITACENNIPKKVDIQFLTMLDKKLSWDHDATQLPSKCGLFYVNPNDYADYYKAMQEKVTARQHQK
jgi:hypothetical protein